MTDLARYYDASLPAGMTTMPGSVGAFDPSEVPIEVASTVVRILGNYPNDNGFNEYTVVLIDGVAYSTTFVNEGELTVDIDSRGMVPTSSQVMLRNGALVGFGGSIQFVDPLAPLVTFVDPPSVESDEGSQVFNIQGDRFVAGAVVLTRKLDAPDGTPFTDSPSVPVVTDAQNLAWTYDVTPADEPGLFVNVRNADGRVALNYTALGIAAPPLAEPEPTNTESEYADE